MKTALGLSMGALLLLTACADTATMSKARGERAGFESKRDAAPLLPLLI